MPVCPRCGASYPQDARFCADDGSPLAESGDAYIGKVLLNQFEIREICGRGSMGVVYRAWQSSMDRDVAIKILHRGLLRDPRVVKRFYREARAAAKLSHANIITVHLVGNTEDHVPFLVMEYVTGRSLDQLCSESGPLPAVRAIHIALQIAAALAEAHSHNIVHRDLKPENIIVSSRKHGPDGVKVLDFGIAKILHAEDESQLTQTGAIFGTPHYLAPEQASGSDIDHRCDLYALGVIIFRMVTGQLPFDHPSGMEVLIQQLKQAPPRPRDLEPTVPPALEAIILRCLEKAPEDRWQSAEALAAALLQALKALDGPAASGARANAAPSAVPATMRCPPTRLDGGASSGATSEHLPGSTTVSMAGDVLSRPRRLRHVMIALASVCAGLAVGAGLHWLRAGKTLAEAQPPTASSAAPAAARVDSAIDGVAATSAADVDVEKTPPVLRPRARRGQNAHRPLPRAQEATPAQPEAGAPPPVPDAPTPPTSQPTAPESDHGGTAEPRGEGATSQPAPEQQKLYDLVD